jgi:hypothetical protein
MNELLKHILNVGLSGWVVAIVFGVVFTLIISRMTETRELLSAKAAMKYEMLQNLDYLSYVYWQYCNPNQHPRDLHYASLNLYPSYAATILKNYPQCASDISWLYSAFDKVLKCNEPVSTQEDMHDFFFAAIRINEIVGLGINNDEIELTRDRDFRIR